MEREYGEITTYRMNQLMQAAAQMTNKMTNSVLHLTYEEIHIILQQIDGLARQIEERNAKEAAE